MMQGLPNEITLRCSDPHPLAALLMQERVAESVRVVDGLLIVATPNPSRVFQSLPRWLNQTGLQVTEMHAADESLQALFNSLMKMHRGEL